MKKLKEVIEGENTKRDTGEGGDRTYTVRNKNSNKFDKYIISFINFEKQ